MYKNILLFYSLMVLSLFNTKAFAGNINIEVSITPSPSTTADNIYINLSASNCYNTKVDWSCVVNTIPDDFGNYPEDNSKREIFQKKGGETSWKVGPMRRSAAGTYIVRVHAMSDATNQGVKTFYFSVIKSEGIIAEIMPSECFDNYTDEVQIGSYIKFVDRAYVGWTNPLKFDGIYKIKWTKRPYETNGSSEAIFNTTYANQENKYNNFYTSGDNVLCCSFPKTGVYTIEFNVWGGKFDYVGTSPRNPLKQVSSNPDVVVKKIIKVVDCSTKLDLTSLANYKADQVFGYVNLFGSAKMSDGKVYGFTAYNNIILKDGFSVKEGTTFSAKAIPAPPFIWCSCSDIKHHFLKSPQRDITDIDDVNSENEFSIKNENNRIDIFSDGIIGKVELYDAEGRPLRIYKDNTSSIDISFLIAGTYVLRVWTNEKMYVRKIIRSN